MKIIGYIIYGIGIVVMFSFLWGIRRNTQLGMGVQRGTVNTTMLFIVSLIVIPLIKLSPLHLLWMFPASFILGTLSLTFPFSLLSIFGNIVFGISCIGLNQFEIARNRARYLKLIELTRNENISVPEAKAKLKESGQW